MGRRILLVAGALALALAIFLGPTLFGKPWFIEHYYLRVLATFAIEHPMLLSYARVLEPLGLDFHSDDLEDLSPENTLHMLAQAEAYLQGLEAYEREDQTPEQLLSTDVLGWFLRIQVDGIPFAFHDYPLDQMAGWHTTLPDFMVNIHQVNDAEGGRDYVARLSKFDQVAEDLLRAIEVREYRDVVPPRFVIEKVRAQIAELVAPAAEEHILYTSLVEKLDALDEDGEGVSEADRADILSGARAAIDDVFKPAYAELDAAMAAQLEIATDEAGVWKLPDGDAFYRWRVRYHTTTDRTPDEVHAIGLDEVDRIHQEMREVLAEAGIEAADPIPQVVALSQQKRFLFSDDDAGREQILDAYREIVAEAEARMPELFGRLPEAAVTVERVPEFREDGAAGAYYQPPAFDGSRPGTFYANLAHTEETARWRMRTLAYHEAVPGHHLQIALAMEQQGVPFFRRVIPFTAFSEGWALYAEQLALEAGWHPTPLDRLGKLEAEVFRAVRLVVDTGIHAKRWSRERAIEYMVANTGMPRTDVVREIERYIVMPGQALAYKIGQLEILRLRDRARDALGDRFDLRAFNDLVLSGGSMPLVVLEGVVENWIEGSN